MHTHSHTGHALHYTIHTHLHTPYTAVTGNPCSICCIQELNLLLIAFTSGDKM